MRPDSSCSRRTSTGAHRQSSGSCSVTRTRAGLPPIAIVWGWPSGNAVRRYAVGSGALRSFDHNRQSARLGTSWQTNRPMASVWTRPAKVPSGVSSSTFQPISIPPTSSRARPLTVLVGSRRGCQVIGAPTMVTARSVATPSGPPPARSWTRPTGKGASR